MRSRDRVLVIGGTGFIGRELVAQLEARGAEVRVLCRHPRAGNPNHLYGEVADRASLRAAAHGVSAVYDVSLGGGPTWHDYQRDFVDGAANVAEVCLEHGMRRMIYTSSTAALHLSGRSTIDESAGADPKPERRSWYARGKILAEERLRELHATRGLPVVIVRPGIVVGRGSRLSHPGVGLWRSPTCCAVMGPGSAPLPFVLVEDVAAAMVLAKDTEGIEGATFNLAGDVRPSAAEWVRWAGERSRRNFELVRQSIVGIQAFRTAVWLGKLALRREDNEWQSWWELKTGPQRTQLDCSAAKTRLGWQPVSDEQEFIRRAIDLHIPPIPPGDLRM
jgi:nucleoside-diphosphate-sugar epimerase